MALYPKFQKCPRKLKLLTSKCPSNSKPAGTGGLGLPIMTANGLTMSPGKVKVKFATEQVVKAQKESPGIVLLFL